MGTKLNYVLEALYDNLLFTAVLLIGLLLIFAGVVISNQGRWIRIDSLKKGQWIDPWSKKLCNLLDRVTSLPPLRFIKKSIQPELALSFPEETVNGTISSTITLAITILSIILVLFLKNAGQLWYVKLMLCIMGLIIPYYISTLLFDLYRYRVNRQIPKMIDEFRSAFIKHNKVRPALKECSLYIDRGLGRIIARTADSTFLEERLKLLTGRLNNVWFNIFAILVLNYKENGGELIDQLYRLNRTMTRYIGVEKKKNKRLIWYEVFAVAASVASIPAIFWLNNIILGSDTGIIIDAQSNMIISRVMGFSILSLIVIRILRKM